MTRTLAMAIPLMLASAGLAGAPIPFEGGVLVGEARDDPAADVSGVAVTAGVKAREGSVAGEIGMGMRRMLDGKMEITFIPDRFLKFLNVNPDQIIKLLPFSHYFSYIFDFTSKLPVKTALPTDPNVAPYKVHVGDPKTNPNVGDLARQMLVRFAPKEGKEGFKLVGPDGKVFEDEDFGVAQILIHSSPAYWNPVIEKIKQWYHRHFKGQRDFILSEIEKFIDEEAATPPGAGSGSTGDGVAAAARPAADGAAGAGSVSRPGTPAGPRKILTGRDLINTFESEKVLGLYWRIFDRFKANLRPANQAFTELFVILRGIALTETIVAGVGDRGLKGTGMLFKIGNSLPFPGIEMLIKLIKDIWDGIRGIPSIDLGWPASDVRMAIVTRYVNEQFVEIHRIYVTPREAAANWHPSFLTPTLYRKVLWTSPQRTRAMATIHGKGE